MNRTILSSIAVCLLMASASASSDPFVGRWILHPEHSKYPLGACPKRMVIEMKSIGNGIRYHSETTYSNGSAMQSNYQAQYNGAESIVVGGRGMLLPVSLKRVDSHTVVASYKRFLQVVATSRRVVSADGRSMTITTTSKDVKGLRVTSVGVYERQLDTPHER